MSKSFFICGRVVLLLAVVLGNHGFRAEAALANVWHIPDNTGDLGFNMRNPEFAIGTSTTVTFYTGVWKWNGGNLVANQTGGTLFYKTPGQSSWSSTALGYYSNSGNNQYWQASVNGSQFNPNDTVQYFFLLTFDGTGSSGATDTWLYGNNAGSTATGSSNTAAASPFSFVVSNNVIGTPVLTVNGVNANYTTTHVFVNELNGDAVPLTILFAPNGGTVTNVEVFSNLNRRDRATLDANSDGIEDGIIAPDGGAIVAGDDGNYYKAYAMTNLGGGNYSLTLNATKTGAYRLTARFKVVGNTNWNWYSSSGRRDHAIVVTPSRARDISMYELNAMTIGSQGTSQGDRSTFTDLYNGPGSRGYDAVTNRFNLQYAQNLGINWLWFQPIHPIGVLNRQTDPDNGNQPYAVGSPYSVKNFFQINPLLSKANTRDAAMQEFTNFVAAADGAGISIMLDEPFNHTSWDAELDASGVYYFKTGASPADLISSSEARFYSRSGEYDQRASGSGNVAVAPDRFDFGKWGDVADVYFGRYAALVPNSTSGNNQTDESDWFDYTIGSENSTSTGNGHFDTVTQNVWRYFSDCVLYWLDKTGCPNGTPANQTYKGIDGVRADFGQGLPPQCWEYIINKVRSRKWDFVFMTESLDGGAVTYRSNRHFDILNENLIFDLQNATTASAYRTAFEARRTAYGQGLVLLNHVSHDEQSYGDPYQALIRHAVVSTVDGAPMVFYGEELGVSTAFGFDLYEIDPNFNKHIPHFKKFNSLQPIFSPANRNYGLDQLWPVYAGINQARNFSKALRSSNRYFLDQTGGGGVQTNIFSVAKYETANAAPNSSDVVFAFATLDRNNPQAGNFNVNITQGGSNLFGIKPGRIYNVKNISAYTAIDGDRRNYWQWGGGIAGSNVLANGVFVSLNPVPATSGGWASNPFEAQYLKLYDVTPPPATSTPGIGSTDSYVFGSTVSFNWAAVTDSEGGVSGYHVLVGTTPGGADVTNVIVSGTSLTVTGSFGAHLYATVTAVNNAGIEGVASTSSGIALVDPAWIPVANMIAPSLLNWSSISGKTYQVWSTTNLSVPFAAYGGFITASAPTVAFTNSATNASRYYKVLLFP
jgi:glycosidase